MRRFREWLDWLTRCVLAGLCIFGVFYALAWAASV